MQISIIKYSEAKEVGRFDAEFYNPENRRVLNLLNLRSSTNFEDYIEELTDGKHGGVTFVESGVVFIRNTNNKAGYIDLSDKRYITILESEESLRAELKPNDILLTTIGTIGESSVVPEDFPRANINQNLVRIKTHSINPYLISTFLNSYHGKNQLYAMANGNVQPMINYPNIRKLQIPTFSNDFQKSIEVMVLTAHDEREKANRLTKEAETLLEKELEIYEWTPPKEALNISIKKHSETKTANRIDAEYYQPKYDAILQKITSYKGGYKTISELCSSNKDTFKIVKDNEYQYIEIGSISVGNGDITPSILIGSDLPANCKRVLYKDNIIVSKVRPYRGAISIVDKDGYVGSGAFTVLKTNIEINKETLCTFLRLPIMLNLSLKPSTGTSYPTIIDEDILNLIIPLIDKNIQDQIAGKITASHKARQESKRLLELAKSTVENAIEHGE